MSIQRVFLGWSQPALRTAAELIFARSSNPGFCDLSHVAAVFPGREAGRRFLVLLTDLADGRLVPPRILTQGQLPELLYPPQRPFASDLVQRMVWAQALKSVPEGDLRRIVSRPPATDDWQAWLRLGDLLRRQHAELAADRLDFADVAREGAFLDGFDETDRWTSLSRVQQQYWSLLDKLLLWDQQTARLVAIKNKECRTDLEIVTVGAIDLNRTTREMLDQVSDRVTALIEAPEDWADRYDAHGCLIAERWADLPVDIAPNQLLMVEDAGAQVEAVLETLSNLNGRYAVDEIAIGVPDPRLVPVLQRTLQAQQIPTHWPVDRLLSATAPFRLLEAIAEYIGDRRTEHFAALIRHPDVAAWLNRQSLPFDWLTRWDDFVCSHLPPRVGWFPEIEDDTTVALARRLVAAVHGLLAPFATVSLPLSRSSTPVRQVLLQVYGDRTLEVANPDDARLRESLKTVLAAFDAHQSLPPSLDLELSAVECLQLTLSSTGGELYRAADGPAIALSGWLEMPLDDAPVAIVTTFNENFVPSSVNHDLFLPNRLRSHLGIEDNARRYARDLHNLTCLLHSRQEVRLIVARRDALNEPLAPSRLLFATRPEQIPERVLQFYNRKDVKPRSGPVLGKSQFTIPRPRPLGEVRATFRVTEFRDYLASPYRYYLRHVLGLEVASDDLAELDGAAFGNLLHDVLKQFGQSELKDATSEAEIAAFLDEELSRSISINYGPDPLAAVLIQAEQARRRLAAFAGWQSRWRQQGWKIHTVERGNRAPIPFSLGKGQTVSLRGRIDRIDFNQSTGQWALFDYKTGDAGASPEKTHRYKDEWHDLQLPLYRHLAEQFGVTGDVRLGYIVLPRDVNCVEEKFADWSEEELETADDVAREVVRNILEERFWVELSEPSQSMTEFDCICQAGVFGQEAVV
ncbi:PD-(D/E)XK nuclease family protein [Planctomicrobium piriforme]|uniref:PD-(D/E)XK nuclease superfamily protein n=1 Tax=Planctomicrobium piriforme TaxID=1576369 RepID=A0A1I3J3J9_9PLAN|nr:PD-(D/E)XK nuclease family protein [Planctomicrobium piriforme]SFI54854.1 PD-(D/E)XK nuclease superfamily protein [Planctomicrobium piriforme]